MNSRSFAVGSLAIFVSLAIPAPAWALAPESSNTTAANADIPRSEYARLIVGKWEIRTYGHEFKADGTTILFNPENGETLEKGTWSIKGDKLSMKWELRPAQKIRIKFLGPDLWEWYSTKDRVWEATRMGAGR